MGRLAPRSPRLSHFLPYPASCFSLVYTIFISPLSFSNTLSLVLVEGVFPSVILVLLDMGESATGTLLPWRLASNIPPFFMLSAGHLVRWLIQPTWLSRPAEFGRKMSPETASPVFPDRLIHPLPKRRLRERLSSDAADLIKYPPAHTPGTPLFYYPYSLKHDAAPAERTIVVGRANLASPTVKPTTTTTAATPAAMAARPGQATNQATRHPSRARRSSSEDESLSPSRTVRHVNRSGRAAQPLHMPPPESHRTIPSTASSVDGYESFENTNNKKKRKIPTAGDTSHGGSYSSTDIHSATSVSSTTNSSDDSLIGSPQSTTYSGPASFVSTSSGISGPGRGRYGRSRSGRSPLHPLTDAGSNWVGRYGKLRLPWPVQPGMFICICL